MAHRKKNRVFSMLIAILVLSSCDSTSSNSTTQVLAKVNDEEITIHQLNQVIRSLNYKGQQTSLEEALESMISQSLLVQGAKNEKLDREPNIVQDIESAKRKLLAEKYLQRKLPKISEPNKSEVNSYYQSHQELFKDRKLFNYRSLFVSNKNKGFNAAIERVAAIGNLKEFEEWLEQEDVKFHTQILSNYSESIPEGLLSALLKLKVNEVGFLKFNDGLLVLEVSKILPQPMDLVTAEPAIKRYLMANNQRNTVNKIIEDLRNAASIEYLGEIQPKTDEEIEVKPDAEPNEESLIEKGLQGI